MKQEKQLNIEAQAERTDEQTTVSAVALRLSERLPFDNYFKNNV